jgi:DNA gyrase/topoisomerase IV subunit A
MPSSTVPAGPIAGSTVREVVLTMTDELTRLQRLEAQLLAATRAQEIIDVASRAETSRAAVPEVMRALGITEEQAVLVLDTQFRVVTVASRRQLEQEIAGLRPSGGAD